MSREFNRVINDLTTEMMKCLYENHSIDSTLNPFIPNRDKVIQIIKNLRKLLFPRHFSGQNVYNCTLEYYIGNLLVKIEQDLHEQIEIALMRKNDPTQRTISPEVHKQAANISVSFMQKLPDIRKALALDLEAFFDGDPAANSIDEIILSYPGMLAIMVYRIAHELYLLEVPIIPRMMSEYAHSRTGVDINPGAKIGSYFFIDHATGVVIGETCEIADHVKLYQGVTLGALSTRGGQALNGVKRHPTIEDNVTIYANATVLGGDTVIGKNTEIGGSCFITKSIPPNATVHTVIETVIRDNNK